MLLRLNFWRNEVKLRVMHYLEMRIQPGNLKLNVKDGDLKTASSNTAQESSNKKFNQEFNTHKTDIAESNYIT
jgi:hypothetical protein